MSTTRTYNPEKYFLLKAEAFCAELLANGASFDDLVVKFKGAFTKSYSNDIETVEQAGDGAGSSIVTINRDGIYDKMPEGLFHQTKGGNNTAALSAMVGEYKRYREEERQARKFFQPIEQELFRYSVLAEQKEQDIRIGILNGNVGSDFHEFWNIEKNLPAKPTSILVLIMPWLKQIKGNKHLTAKALSMVLEKPVDVVSQISNRYVAEHGTFLLGADTMLGVDSICGNQLDEPIEQWVFSINGLKHSEMYPFTQHQPYGKFLKKFEELFIPLEVEVKFDYEYESATEATEQGQILGYGYCL